MTENKLPAIVGALSNEYMDLALMNFTMEFYNFYEQFYDGGMEYIENGRELISNIVKAAANIYSEEMSDDDVNVMLEKSRKKVMDMMETLTSYADWFQIHEYLLNRVELRFEDELPEVDNDEEAKKLLQFIFEPEDNMEVNLRIKEMISQLPVRMTTSRFYDLLKDSVTVYKGAEKETLDGFIYMVLSAAGLYKPDNNQYFTELAEYKSEFEDIVYKDITKEQFKHLSDKMFELSEIISEGSEFCIYCQKLINNLYTYYLVEPYREEESAAKKVVSELITLICKSFEYEFAAEGNFVELDLDKADDTFIALEGKPEKLITKISVSEGKLESAKDETDAIDPEIYINFIKASKLMSSSDFAKIDDCIDITECTDEIIEAASVNLLEQISNEFNDKERQVRRAMMASVLKELPVFFVSHTEVMNYVRFTLEHCKDKAEKTASLRMFWQVYE